MKWKTKRKIDIIKKYIRTEAEDLDLGTVTEIRLNLEKVIEISYRKRYSILKHLTGVLKIRGGEKVYDIWIIPRLVNKGKVEGILFELIYEVEDKKKD